ncbi:hypothetical protein [Candidatus Methanoprimaticola sp. MG2]|uniref:hypothetical protein n=1 Tax=Candidatus Methanoprimaticola sp. MG2 TaxID=3228838 RepID=UPI0039C6E8FC
MTDETSTNNEGKIKITGAEDVIINGNGHSITALDGAKNKNIMFISSTGAVEIYDLTLKGSLANNSTNHHGINIYESDDVTLVNVTSNNNGAAGIQVNGSNVTAMDITANGNQWGAINVDKTSKLTLTGENDLGTGFQIWSEEAGKVDAAGFEKYGWQKTSDIQSKGMGAVWFEGGKITSAFTIGETDTIDTDGKVLAVQPGASVTISNGAKFSGTLGFGNSKVTMIDVTGGTDGIKFSYGAATVAKTTGAAADVIGIKGSVTENNGIITVFGEAKLTGKVTIPSGVTLSIDAGSTLTIPKSMTLEVSNGGNIVNGGVIETEDSTAKVDLKSGATLTATPGSETSGVTPTGTIKAYKGAKINGEEVEIPITTPESVKTEEMLVTMINANVPSIKVTEDIQLSSDLEIPQGITIVVSSGKSLKVGDGVVLTNNGTMARDDTTNSTGKISITGTGKFVNNGELDILLRNGETSDTDRSIAHFGPIGKAEDGLFSGSFEFTEGSIKITGTIDEGKITVWKNDVKITGEINGNLVIVDKESNTDNTNVIFENVTINSSAVVKLDENITSYSFKGEDNYIYGTIVPLNDKPVEMTVGDKAALKAFTGAKISGKITIKAYEGGKIDLSQAQNPQNVGEDISADKTYGQLESVTIVDTLNIKNNSTVTVEGSFHVNEGVTLTIESGSKLIIDSVAASMVIDGRIIVEEGAVLEVRDADNVKVAGSIESEGAVTIGSTVTIKADGRILADSGDKSSLTITEGLTVEAGGILDVRTAVTTGDDGITNKGTVTLNGAVLNGNVAINMAANGAVVEIKSFTGNNDNTLTITDLGMEFKKDTAYVTNPNSIELKITENQTGFKGIVITESITSYKDKENKTVYKNHIALSGTLGIADERSEANDDPDARAVVVAGPSILVPETLVVPADVTLTVNGKMSVAGTLTANTDKEINGSGEITVTGLIQTQKKIKTATVNAAMYETTVEGETVYNYTTLKAAIDSKATDITTSGKVKVNETLEIPAGVTVRNNGTIVIGNEDKRDVVVTVKNGATIRNGNVEVDGTLVFENKKDNRAGKIVSDVSVIGEVDSRYTNIYTALNEAESGDVVTITSEETVVLDANATIKAGVTLDVPNSKNLELNDGVTLTVNGTLKTAHEVTPQTDFAEEASVLNKTSAMVVNGTFMSMEPVDYATYEIAGAYYTIVNSLGDYDYVSPLDVAAHVEAEINGGTIYVYGKNTAGDVEFIGTEDVPVTINVIGSAELTASSITLDEASIYIYGTFTGSVTVADATVAANKVGYLVISSEDGDEDRMVIKGDASDEDDKASLKIESGTVAVLDLVSAEVSADATVVVPTKATLSENDASSYGLPAIADTVIYGTVKVASGETMTVYGVSIFGTLDVAAETDTTAAGTLNGEGLMIGVDIDDLIDTEDDGTTGAAATVNGPLDVSEIVVLNGSSLSESTLESMKDMKSTAYDVEGSVWITVYDSTGGFQIGWIEKAPVKNAEFTGKWLDADKKPANDKPVGEKDYETVYAEVNYEIYDVFVYANDGIANVYLNGDIMKKGSIDEGGKTIQGFMATVKAGDYTITFDLAQGWNGNVTMKVNGKDVSGTSFEASGDKAEGTGTEYMVQLSGVEKSDAPVTPVAPSGDDGMTITDYLLIILVVLIVVMAIIVAMRLMRS